MQLYLVTHPHGHRVLLYNGSPWIVAQERRTQLHFGCRAALFPTAWQEVDGFFPCPVGQTSVSMAPHGGALTAQVFRRHEFLH